jgi:tetrahydromethanopterin S-methyltransferase subunit D
MLKPWKNLKMRDKIGFAMSALLIFGINMAIGTSIRTHEPVMVSPPATAPAEIEPATADTKVEAMLKSGECWTGGEGHPLPTRVVYAGELRGAKMVDKTLKALFDGADNGVDPKLISAYCK